MEKTKLEVGDVIYDHQRWGGLVRYTIEKVTEKQAVYSEGRLRCKREFGKSYFGSNLTADKIGSYGSVVLENDDIKSEYSEQQLMLRVKNLKHDVYRMQIENLSIAQLEEIESLLNSVMKVQGSVATKAK